MEIEKQGNRRIAKNAIFLYVRMIVMMVITLFTSREILRILGVDDFGLYNVIGGIIVLFAFFQTALVDSSQRFFAFEIGKGYDGNVKKVFNISVLIHIFLVFFVLIISETLGLWFVNNKLTIPDGYKQVVNIVYQVSVITFVVNIFRTPFNSLIIAYEKMSFYAYISIIEAVLKLAIVYLLLHPLIDKLIFYSLLVLLVSIIIFILYYSYCRIKFGSCKFEFIWDAPLIKEMISYSGWSLLGGVSNVTAQQGCNILLNVYSGLIANASFGIANQVSQAIYLFSRNVLSAFSPQIIKLYSSGLSKDLFKLVNRSSLASYYMMLIIAVPCVYKMDFILGLWLDSVPSYASAFCIYMVLYQLVDAQQGTLNVLIHATGNIKNYYIWLSLMISICLPISWILLVFGISPIWVIITRFINNVLTMIVRIFYMNKVIVFPTREYLVNVIGRSLLVTIIVFAIVGFVYRFLIDGVYSCFLFLVASITISIVVVLIVGFDSKDKKALTTIIINRIQRN